MSAFDDEFGLFGDEAGPEDERKSTLGARKIATGETIIDEIEPEDEPAPRRREGGRSSAPRRSENRAPKDPAASQARATELLVFLAKKLVSNPDAIKIDTFTGDRGEPVLELAVDPEDLGKVIGRSGRVAQALRTIVRATAEGKITIDILDTDEYEAGFEDEAEDDPADETGQQPE